MVPRGWEIRRRGCSNGKREEKANRAEPAATQNIYASPNFLPNSYLNFAPVDVLGGGAKGAGSANVLVPVTHVRMCVFLFILKI